MRLRSKIFETGTGPRLLITRGMHGDEFEPIAATGRLMLILEIRQVRAGTSGIVLVLRTFPRVHQVET